MAALPSLERADILAVLIEAASGQVAEASVAAGRQEVWACQSLMFPRRIEGHLALPESDQ